MLNPPLELKRAEPGSSTIYISALFSPKELLQVLPYLAVYPVKTPAVGLFDLPWIRIAKSG
jgi:hypothetical protein